MALQRTRTEERALRASARAVPESRENEPAPEGRERHLVGQRPRLEVRGREDHAGRGQKRRRGRDERGPVEQARGEKQEGDEQFDGRIADVDGGSAPAAAAPEHQPGQDRHVVVEGDRLSAGGAMGARVDDREPARKAVDADVRERPHDGARREEQAQQDAVSRVHGGLCPARTRPARTTSEAMERAAPARNAAGR